MLFVLRQYAHQWLKLSWNYWGTFVFTNGLCCLDCKTHQKSEQTNNDLFYLAKLLEAQAEWFVFPQHIILTLPRICPRWLLKGLIFKLGKSKVAELSKRVCLGAKYFWNKGAAMGCSNPSSWANLGQLTYFQNEVAKAEINQKDLFW